MDVAAALARVDGDRGFLGEMAVMFLEESPRLLAQIREAVAAGDAAGLVGPAHTLKNWTGNFVASAAFEAVTTLEAMGRARDSRDRRGPPSRRWNERSSGPRFMAMVQLNHDNLLHVILEIDHHYGGLRCLSPWKSRETTVARLCRKLHVLVVDDSPRRSPPCWPDHRELGRPDCPVRRRRPRGTQTPGAGVRRPAVLTDLPDAGTRRPGACQRGSQPLPGVPVVLMTAHGSEEIAILALQAGAASYVPKRRSLVNS